MHCLRHHGLSCIELLPLCALCYSKLDHTSGDLLADVDQSNVACSR